MVTFPHFEHRYRVAGLEVSCPPFSIRGINFVLIRYLQNSGCGLDPEPRFRGLPSPGARNLPRRQIPGVSRRNDPIPFLKINDNTPPK